jgi:hypothetical protein
VILGHKGGGGGDKRNLCGWSGGGGWTKKKKLLYVAHYCENKQTIPRFQSVVTFTAAVAQRSHEEIFQAKLASSVGKAWHEPSDTGPKPVSQSTQVVQSDPRTLAQLFAGRESREWQT